MQSLKKLIAGGLAVLALAGATGCVVPAGNASTTAATSSAGTAALTLADDHDTPADHDYDAASAVAVDLADPKAADGLTAADGVITITRAGVYRLTGTLADGQVVVDTEDSANVHLILDGATITNDDGAAIAVTKAEEVVVVLADGSSNTLTDGKNYALADGEDEPDATLFSTADLTIAGTGALTVNGNHNDAIAGQDGLVIVSGTITVTATDDGIRGKDYLVVDGGTVTVTSGDDALKSDNETDGTLGYLAVNGGTLTIAAGDDALHSVTALNVSGGTLDITSSVEGLESKTITISGGTTTVVSSDDAVNATDTLADSSQPGPGNAAGVLAITGGELTVTADGDGIDVNGSVTMSGGTVVVNGPTGNGNGSLDYDGTFLISGGSLAAGGSAGMAMAPTAGSTQKSLMATVTASAGSTIEIRDPSGNVVATFRAARQVGNLVVSNTAITEGVTYTVLVDGTQATTTDTSKATSQAGPSGGRRR